LLSRAFFVQGQGPRWTGLTPNPGQKPGTETFWDRDMARSVRSKKLEKLENRERLDALKPAGKPVYVRIGRGIWLGYRRNKTNGTWVVRVLKGGQEWTRRIADADDYDESNGCTVLDFFEAQSKARELAGAGRDGRAGHKPVTISEAVDDWERD